MSTLQILDAENFASFCEHPNRVLILSKSNCPACQQWQAELESEIAQGTFPAKIRMGKLNLDQPGLSRFKKDSPWLKEVTDLPYNVIYQGNELLKKWPGGGTGRLITRLRNAGLID